MARWTASAKWAEGPALDGQRDMPLALRLSEGLDRTRTTVERFKARGAATAQVLQVRI